MEKEVENDQADRQIPKLILYIDLRSPSREADDHVQQQHQYDFVEDFQSILSLAGERLDVVKDHDSDYRLG